MRIIRSSEWRDLDDRRTRLLGLYGYVADTSSVMTITVKLEEHPDQSIRLEPHAVALAAFDAEPEVEEPQVAQSSADVELVERIPYTGRPQYSTYRIGQNEGTATLIYHSMRWELTFADTGSNEYDGGEAGPYDDSPTGAWNAWNRARGLL